MTDEGSFPTIYLHIGTPKSGTTYLQSRMEANRERAREQGLLWPGPRWGVQVEAVRVPLEHGPEVRRELG